MKVLIAFGLCLLLNTNMEGQSIGATTTNMYVYNDGKDTIHLTKIDLGKGFGSTDYKVIDSVQVDGFGAQELVFYREGSRSFSDHGGTFDIVESKRLAKYEIWNLDSKKLLFEARTSWFYDFNIFRAGMPPRKGTEQYSYNLAIDKSGKITIFNFKGVNADPDHRMGTYVLINDKYIKTNR